MFQSGQCICNSIFRSLSFASSTQPELLWEVTRTKYKGHVTHPCNVNSALTNTFPSLWIFFFTSATSFLLPYGLFGVNFHWDLEFLGKCVLVYGVFFFDMTGLVFLNDLWVPVKNQLCCDTTIPLVWLDSCCGLADAFFTRFSLFVVFPTSFFLLLSVFLCALRYPSQVSMPSTVEPWFPYRDPPASLMYKG